MGCKCKEKIDYIKALGDDAEERSESKLGFFGNIFKFLFRLVFGIICGAIIIIVAVPALIYVIICLLFGLNPKFNISWLIRKKRNMESKINS